MRILLILTALWIGSHLRAADPSPTNEDIFAGLANISLVDDAPSPAAELIFGYEHRVFGSQSWKIQARYFQTADLGNLIGGDLEWSVYFNRKKKLCGPFLGLIFEVDNFSDGSLTAVEGQWVTGTACGPGFATGYQWIEGSHLVVNVSAGISLPVIGNEITYAERIPIAGLQISFGWIQ